MVVRCLVLVWRVGTHPAVLYPPLPRVDGMCQCSEQAAVGRPEPANRDAEHMLLFFALSGMGICPSWHAKNPVSFLVVAGHSSTSEVARVSSLWRLSKACRVVTDGASAGRDCGSKARAVLCPHLVMDLAPSVRPAGRACRAWRIPPGHCSPPIDDPNGECTEASSQIGVLADPAHRLRAEADRNDPKIKAHLSWLLIRPQLTGPAGLRTLEHEYWQQSNPLLAKAAARSLPACCDPGQGMFAGPREYS
jgi:hypothetical protein